MPLAAAAAIAALAATVLLVIPQPRDAAPAMYAADEPILEIDNADLDLELVGELEFYDWLALAQLEEDPS